MKAASDIFGCCMWSLEEEITDYQGQWAPEEAKTDLGSSWPAPAEDKSWF